MAANFWLSSHCNQWLLDREEIELERQRDYQYLKGDEYKKIHIFFVNFIQALGEHLKLRQQGGPARVNSDERHDPKSSDRA